MTTLVVLPSKRRVDVQQYTVSFANVLNTSDTISSATVVVRLFTGVDPQPELILFEAFVQTDYTITQKIQEGVPGVIYELVITVTTTLGYIHTITARLAILPELLGASPNLSPFFLSSKPYLEYIVDGITISALPLSGFLKDPFILYEFDENVSIFAEPIDGRLRDAFISTNYTEGLNLSAIPIDGTLRVGLHDYTFNENLSLFADPIDGILREALVVTESTEGLNLTAVPIGGSLYVP